MTDLDPCPACDVLGYECNACRNARNSRGFTTDAERMADFAADEHYLRND